MIFFIWFGFLGICYLLSLFGDTVSYNDGKCNHCGGAMIHSDTDSLERRQHTCINCGNHVWVTDDSIDGHWRNR